MQDSSSLASDAVAAEITLSAPVYGPLRHSFSVAGMTRSESGYAENRFGYYLGYRHLLTDRVFIEPQAGLVYLQHSRQQVQGQAQSSAAHSSWDRTSARARARAFGIVAGYRPGPRTELMMSVRRYQADIEVQDQTASGSCVANCDGVDNVVHNPYAGLDLPASVDDLNNRTIISLSAGMSF
jgi:hypothetical protein